MDEALNGRGVSSTSPTLLNMLISDLDLDAKSDRIYDLKKKKVGLWDPPPPSPSPSLNRFNSFYHSSSFSYPLHILHNFL